MLPQATPQLSTLNSQLLNFSAPWQSAKKGGHIMGFHFRKSFKIGKLFRFNKNKKGGSISIDGPKIAGKKLRSR
jgi:hypothetical protein